MRSLCLAMARRPQVSFKDPRSMISYWSEPPIPSRVCFYLQLGFFCSWWLLLRTGSSRVSLPRDVCLFTFPWQFGECTLSGRLRILPAICRGKLLGILHWRSLGCSFLCTHGERSMINFPITLLWNERIQILGAHFSLMELWFAPSPAWLCIRRHNWMRLGWTWSWNSPTGGLLVFCAAKLQRGPVGVWEN